MAEVYSSEIAWKDALARSEIRLQWDPDHDPSGAKVKRRAIQLGLRGGVLTRYAYEWIIEIKDITKVVRQQHLYAQSHAYHQLVLPKETVYAVTNKNIIRRLGLAVELLEGASTSL